MNRCVGVTSDGTLCQAYAITGFNTCRWHHGQITSGDEQVSDTEPSTSATLYVSDTDSVVNESDILCPESPVTYSPYERVLSQENRTIMWMIDPPLTVLEFMRWANRGVHEAPITGVVHLLDDDVDTFTRWIQQKKHRLF